MKKKIIRWLIYHSKTAMEIIQYHRNEVAAIYEHILENENKS